MRIPILLALCTMSATQAAAQGAFVPLRCGQRCSSVSTPDSVTVSVSLDRGMARSYVDVYFGGAGEGAFFFPVPADATVTGSQVTAGRDLLVYNRWSGDDESRWILQGILRQRGGAIRAYAGRRVVHVDVPSQPVDSVRRVRIEYVQPLVRRSGEVAWAFPMSAVAGRRAQPVRIVMDVRDSTGFRSVSSSHEVDVSLGTETDRCPPQARCGSMGVPSQRARVVRFAGTGGAPRDFRFAWIPGNLPARDPHSALKRE